MQRSYATVGTSAELGVRAAEDLARAAAVALPLARSHVHPKSHLFSFI